MTSAQRAIDILEKLAEHPLPLEAATISRMCGIPRSSTYLLLNTLRARGFVALHGRRGWHLGERLEQLRGHAPTMEQSIRVLGAFHHADERVALDVLADRSGVEEHVAHRVLGLLVAEHVVSANPDGTFSLGGAWRARREAEAAS